MPIFSSSPESARLTLRVLAHLLAYPNAELRSHIPEMRQALRREAALSGARRDELDGLLRYLASRSAFDVESEYVDLFDRGRRTALHLFEHVHGDSRDRGPAMIDLIQTYEKAGLLLSDSELPDYLPVVLEFASTQPTVQAREFLGEIAHIVRAIFSALQDRSSPYASVLAAVLEVAGEKAEAVVIAPEPEMDESWAEPEVFGGCSVAGQAKPAAPQPIQFVKKPTAVTLGERA